MLSKNSASRLVTLIHKSIIAEQIKNSFKKFTLHFQSPNQTELSLNPQPNFLLAKNFNLIARNLSFLKGSNFFKKFLKKELLFQPSWVFVPSTVPPNSEKSVRSCFSYGSSSCLTRLLALFRGCSVQLLLPFWLSPSFSPLLAARWSHVVNLHLFLLRLSTPRCKFVISSSDGWCGGFSLTLLVLS